MASTTQEDEAYLNGTHPALVGGNTGTTQRSRSDSMNSTPDDTPAFTVPTDGPTISNGTPSSSYRPRSGGANKTGPKGVIADFKAAQLAKAEDAGRSLHGMAKLAVTAPVIISLNDDSDEEKEDDAIVNYRRQRLAELNGSGQRVGVGKVFGHLREIGEAQFLSSIEEEDRDVAVVLHLYEPEFEACDRLNYHLASIARAYPYTKFIRALATEVEFSTDTEEDTLPTLLVYRGGELEVTIVRVDREWGSGTRQEVLNLLVRHKTLSVIPTIPFTNDTRRSPLSRTNSQDSD